MQSLGLVLAGLVVSAFTLFCAPLIGTLVGVWVGWAVGLFLEDEILGIAAQVGIQGVSMWQLGAFFGFVGGFFRSPRATKQ